MKKMKFAVWFTALLTMITFTSCFDDDVNNTSTIIGYAKVGGNMGSHFFVNQINQKFIPTNQNALPSIINSNYAYIVMSINQDEQRTEGQYEGVLKDCAFSEFSYLKPYNEEEIKAYKNAPINLISKGDVLGAAPVGFWDPNKMFVPVYFLEKKSNNDSDNQSEKMAHSFSFYYRIGSDAKIFASTEDDLIIYVRHHVTNPEENQNRNNLSRDLYEINLTQAISDFEQQKNKKPTKLIIEYEQNQLDGKYDTTTIGSASVIINYDELLKNFQKK